MESFLSRSHTFTRANTHFHTCKHTLSHVQTHTFTRANTHMQTHTHARTRTLTHAHMLTHKQTHTPTHTHTHKHALGYTIFRRGRIGSTHIPPHKYSPSFGKGIQFTLTPPSKQSKHNPRALECLCRSQQVAWISKDQADYQGVHSTAPSWHRLIT